MTRYALASAALLVVAASYLAASAAEGPKGNFLFSTATLSSDSSLGSGPLLVDYGGVSIITFEQCYLSVVSFQ